MPADVSVIVPAYRAIGTIAAAVQSVFAQKGIEAEVVLCADDDLDYMAALREVVPAGSRLMLCRTPAPKSGPSVARNLALDHVSAEIIACLDADDVYGPDRLRLLLPAVERYGVATGPTLEVDPREDAVRVARPRLGGDRLTIEDICELRMPFPPVFHRKTGVSWPLIDFAEDVILNVELYCATGTYPFIERAEYIYQLGNNSRSHSTEALEEARSGYRQILRLVDARNWPPAVREVVRRVFSEDLRNVETALSRVGAGQSWRSAVRDAPTG